MKHNVFDTDEMQEDNYLSHSDMQAIFADAKRCGSLREAVDTRLDGGTLMHATTVPTAGMELPTGNQTYGFNDPNMLFPEYRSFQTTPEWISRDMAWVSKVMSGVHHSPFSQGHHVLGQRLNARYEMGIGVMDGVHALGGSVAEEVYLVLVEQFSVCRFVHHVCLYVSYRSQRSVEDLCIYFHASRVYHRA